MYTGPVLFSRSQMNEMARKVAQQEARQHQKKQNNVEKKRVEEMLIKAQRGKRRSPNNFQFVKMNKLFSNMERELKRAENMRVLVHGPPTRVQKVKKALSSAVSRAKTALSTAKSAVKKLQSISPERVM